MKQILTYPVREVAPYINWIYYFHVWGMEPRFAAVADIHDCPACRASWIATFPVDERAKACEAMKIYQEAQALLRQWADEPLCHAIFLLAKAYSDGDDIVINNKTRIPFLRQQHVGKMGHTLCLSDFIHPKTTNTTDHIGVFATTVSHPSNFQFSKSQLSDSKDCLQALSTGATSTKLILNFQFDILADRLAEATAEKMHEEVRRHYWGYVPNERFTMRELHAECFQGIRPAVGYPSLPDQSINFLIDELLCMKDIGITLSENGAMHPHSSISGFMFAHPKAHYFSVGNITQEQLTDYSQRRGFDIEQMRKFLAAIIH